MKQLIILISFLLLRNVLLCQELNKYLGSEMYVYPWNAKPQYPVTEESILKMYHLKIINRSFEPNCFCRNYLIFKERLLKGKILDEKSGENINALVDFNFDSPDSTIKIIAVSFDTDGNYYFDGNWYEIDPLMYYYLFKSLNNDMIQSSVMDSIKRRIKRKALCWYLIDEK